MQLDLSVNGESQNAVKISFDRIAKELMLNWSLQINDELYQLVDLEFFYYKEGIHPDRSTHEHKVDRGKWRGHQNGIDMSLGIGSDWDGGILLRGIKSDRESIIGPKKVLWEIFRQFGDFADLNKKFGLVRNSQSFTSSIESGTRHGLGSSVQSEFKEKPYRYYIDKIQK